MKTIALLKNSIQEYEWGSFTAIPKLLGAKWPFDKPAAELWIGAHPKAPSKVYYNKKWISLLNLLEEYPEDILGKETASKFKNRLPFLFKVLAAEKPLSIQAHPDRTQAIEGFEKENQLKIALNAFNRNYRDENHKPELICALTPFEALNGFRPVNEIIANIEKVCPNSLKEEKEYLLSKPGETGVKAFFHSLLTMEYDRKKAVIESAIINISDSMKNEPCFKWMIKLYEQYPDDIGAFSPLILNLVVLNSGQAMFIASKQLHGYLNGVGIEVMANSDNVLRVGLTSKHIDTEELLKVLDFKERKIEIINPERVGDAECIYKRCAEEFFLHLITVNKGINYISPLKRSVEMLICTEGKGAIISLNEKNPLNFSKGTSFIIPTQAGQYQIYGNAVLYKVSVPL